MIAAPIIIVSSTPSRTQLVYIAKSLHSIGTRLACCVERSALARPRCSIAVRGCTACVSQRKARRACLFEISLCRTLGPPARLLTLAPASLQCRFCAITHRVRSNPWCTDLLWQMPSIVTNLFCKCPAFILTGNACPL
jgi:hypothetical protein